MLKNNGFHNRHSPVLRFSPLSLFSSGAPGAWYDPSDYGATGTLFQDSAGTTPVTAVEQPVGLMLDKSQGLVLGPELWANQTPSIVNFGGTVGVYNTGTRTMSNSGAAVAGYPRFDFNLGMTAGRTYLVSGTLSGSLTQIAQIRLAVSGVANDVVYNNSTGVFQGRVTAAGQILNIVTTLDGAEAVTISSISVRELPGNHAFQSTSASRPVLSARYNLLTKTEDLSDAAWTKLGAAVSSTDTIIATSAFGAVYETPSKTATATQFILTVEFAAGTVSAGRLTIAEAIIGTAGVGCDFTLTGAGSAGTPAAYGAAGWVAGPATIQSIGDGWYRCTLTATSSTTTAISGVAGHTGTAIAGNTVKARKTSLVPANQSTLPYQRVNTATDYDTTGFLPYLKFDGVDDSLSTNSISFTSTDKMSVFAGVRKLSDAAIGVPVELSANTSANTGAFVFAAPATTANANYFWGSRGSAALVGATTTNSFASPITNVFTGLGDISGDLSALRLNGAQVAQSTADQGTGNFGNYPLYIGRRNNASLPFNGQLYSMVIVGKAVTAGELLSTETYVNQKTGAY